MTCNNYLCFTQWWWSSSHLCGGRAKEGAEGGKGSLSVRRREQPELQITTKPRHQRRKRV